VNEGEFSVRSSAGLLPFKKGQGVLAKCFNYFFETNGQQRSQSEGVQVIGVLMYPHMLQELFQFDLSVSTHTVDFNVKQVPLDALLEHYRESISILLDHPELADEAMLATKLKEFVLLISRSQQAPSHLDFLAAMFRPNALEFKRTIQQNIYANLSSEQLAALCHLSLSSFKRKFNEIYGESPKRYLNRMKLEKAVVMLRQPKARISEVAFEVGFESLATFNRSFRLHYGKSPSDYR
jgi:AraC family transcriptional regulator, exoenzyme S synthesis regulatory protein ExsA